MQTKQLEIVSLWATMGFGFFSVIPYAIAGKNIFSVLMLICLLLLIFKKRFHFPSVNWVNGSFGVLLALTLCSALISPTLSDSLAQIRKETLPFAVAFLLLVCVRDAGANEALGRVKYFMYALILGYLIKEALAISDGIANNFIFSIYETADNTLPRYLDFFSTDTVFYLPLLFAVAGFWPMRAWLRIPLWAAIICALLIVAFSGVRTTFVVASFELGLFVLLRYWNYKKYVLLGVVSLAAIAFGVKDYVTNPSVARYYSVFTPRTYAAGNDGSVSERFAIARAVWEVSQDRKWIGYGPGWKKLPTVAEEKGFMLKWQESSVPWEVGAYRYFSYGEGRVNPHNLYAQFIFEIGLLGLAAYLVMLAALLFKSLGVLTKQKASVSFGMAYAGLAYVIVYYVAGMSGGLWLPVTLLVYLAWFSLPQGSQANNY